MGAPWASNLSAHAATDQDHPGRVEAVLEALGNPLVCVFRHLTST